MFFAISVLSIVGLFLARTLRRRMSSGTAQRVAQQVIQLDAALGLQGEEKKLSDLIDQANNKNKREFSP
jgi:hypothetical protein